MVSGNLYEQKLNSRLHF